ncbi:diaminopropionate ammonia-lyase [Plectosphaerella plurivora]|uniref:Diaminopropionate ammonia-lyase n=1 Tax=Plectosphaerella plurivora TaxID=936078 RepID=A0A9P9AE21_9PEZI|nr:diaminopropionate ammonia-lyase [Plectosphaerella plurivora]
MSSSRKTLFFNQATSPIIADGDLSLARKFHSQLPGFSSTPLTSLEDLAEELGVKAVFVKDESLRLGLPAFKILGASWGTCRAIISQFGLPLDISFEDLASCAQKHSIVLFTASAGNHGRAIAAMARMLNIKAKIYVPRSIDAKVVDLIASEGAEVIVSPSDYDGAMMEAFAAAKSTTAGLFVQDSSFEGYEEIPAWIVEGYSGLLAEVDEQLSEQNLKPDLIVTPAGVGSLTHAVVRHAKSNDRAYAVMAVEPDTAACVYKSLKEGKPCSVPTSKTIMEGLNCGTISTTAFEDLRSGIDVCVTVSDFEAHQAVGELSTRGIRSGPCGAATLAGLRRLASGPQRPAWLTRDAVVVILNTEGPRPYMTPLDVSIEDPVGLTQLLTTIASANPDLSDAPGSGETAIAEYIFAWLTYRGLEAHWIEPSPGRPSIVGVLRGTGGGKSLMFNGHIDTVSLTSYGKDADPLSGELRPEDGGRIYGRGCLDMKAGVASAMAVLATLASPSAPKLRGDVILAAVADEENFSKGTEDVLAAGWSADVAIIPEPTSQDMVTAHRGFVWVEIDVVGKAAHGSQPQFGVDAILLSGALQVALLEYGKTLPTHPKLGKAHLHGGRIVGGEEPSSYPAKCTLTVEFRTVPPQTPSFIIDDLEKLLADVAARTPGFAYEAPRVTFSRPGSALPDDHPLVESFASVIKDVTGQDIKPGAAAFWCDAGLLNEAGIPSVVYGPKGEGLHAAEEWVSIESIGEVTTILESAARKVAA